VGTRGYVIVLTESWYRHTLSNNTVFIDGARQPPATGRLLRFEAPRWGHGSSKGSVGLIDAEVAWPRDAHDVVLGEAPTARRAAEAPMGVYDGVTMRRLVALRGQYVVDVFWVSCPEEREIEWVYHNLGRVTRLGPSGSADTVVDFTTGQAGLRLWLAAAREDGADLPEGVAGVTVSEAPANPASELMPLLRRRRRAKSAVFASVFDPHSGRPSVRAVMWDWRKDMLYCTVERRGKADRWSLPVQRVEGDAMRGAVNVEVLRRGDVE
jgi:hypothetical protein